MQLQVRGDRKAAERLQRMAGRARKTRPLFRRIVDELVSGERRWWRSPRGWPELAASTKARKRREGLPTRKLRATGELERFLTGPGREGGQFTIRKDSVRFGIPGGRSDVFYGRFHQQGKGVPERRVVVLTARTKRNLNKVTREHLGVA